MDYYFSKTITDTFDNAINKVILGLKTEGFGVLTEIDVKATFKKKLDADLYNYKILGACNPIFAYNAIQVEDKIGTMLPCNVIIQEKIPGQIEISAIDPLISMLSIDNKKLQDIASEVRKKIQKVIKEL